MARDPRRAALRRALRSRRTGWWLAAALALLGILLGAQRLGWQRLTRAADLVCHALVQAARLALDAGWLLLLLAAVGLALGLVLSSRRGRAVVHWLQARLTTRALRWSAASAGVLILLVLVVVVLPPRFTAHRHFDKASDELKAQNDVRTTLLQALAGGVLLLGAYFTYRQLRVTREGQITDRYTKAVDQLGSEHLDVRLGGIYALERIARDSPPDRATIEEVLTAYVRGHAPWPPPPAAPSEQTGTQQSTTAATPQPLATTSPGADTGMAGQPDKEVAEPQGPEADVQAAMTVLGRRELPPGGLRPLDLTRVDLHDVDLGDANLQGAYLGRANLQDAWLDRADLRDAGLDDANLQGAYLGRANLQDAELDRADLRRAGLVNANLRGAKLAGANLQGAGLFGANLEGAVLFGANLQGAELDRADLQGARASEFTRWPDGWTPDTARDRGVRYSD